MSRNSRLVLTAVICLVASASLLRTQEVRATLGGRVTDAQGAVVRNAEIEVKSLDTNVVQHTHTNSQGKRSERGVDLCLEKT
jgi:hypothetical protein